MDFTKALDTVVSPASGLDAFDDAVAVPDYVPLPPGVYTARVVRGEYYVTKAGADAYRMRWEVTEGPLAGRSVMRIWSFTHKAIGYSKGVLAKFGLTSKTHLLSPFPPAGKEIQCRLFVVLQRGDDGIEHNDVKRVDVLRVVDSPAAAFMLPEQGDEVPQ